VIVRLASEEDLPRLMEIEDLCFGPERFSQETVQAFLVRDDAFIVVAEELEELRGSAMCTTSDERGEGRIASLAVPERMRGRGIGGMLLDECEKVFVDLGMTVYSLEVETVNEPAIAIYSSHRYEISSIISDFYGRGRPAYAMIKRRTTEDGVAIMPS